MTSDHIKVIFQPSGRTVYVLPDTLLLEAAGRAGIILQTPCGGNGTCGKCKVQVNSRNVSDTKLACQFRVQEDITVGIPRESLFETTGQILTSDHGAMAVLDPVVTKQHFVLPQPTAEDSRSDIERLRAELGDVVIPFELMRRIPGLMRKRSWQGTAVLVEQRLKNLEEGDTSACAFGVAIDLGTTTIVGTLFDLMTGEEKAVASLMNPQTAFGDDVIARISRIMEHPNALPEMGQAVIGALNRIVRRLAETAQIQTEHIYEITLAGNSCMQQIACGLDPAALGEVPFVQVTNESLNIPVRDLGLRANAAAEVFVFPQIGGFVGGDTVAGILAAQMDCADGPVLLVDIGTNGEIVLAHEGKLEAASTAAGPAFEGARIVQGMRATVGAIEKVVIGEDVSLNVIGNVHPVGLCGTGLIDSVAELLRLGIITENGKILSREEVCASVSPAVADRLTLLDDGMAFLLTATAVTPTKMPVYLRQRDVRELQMASGAIRAGINILLRRAGLAPHDLEGVLLAGAFGNFIRRSNARRVGLLPAVPSERIQFIGNAASLGAKLALLAEPARKRAEEIGRKTAHVDLSLDANFQDEFMEAMLFPSEDTDAFARQETRHSRCTT